MGVKFKESLMAEVLHVGILYKTAGHAQCATWFCWQDSSSIKRFVFSSATAAVTSWHHVTQVSP